VSKQTVNFPFPITRALGIASMVTKRREGIQ
jgi:hypothetical protein